MAKRATNKPSAAKAAAADIISPEVLDDTSRETPPGALGVLTPVAPLSDNAVVLDEHPPEIVVATLEDHPAIALAQSFVTPHGVPGAEMGAFYTPPPPELRKPKKA